MTDALYQKFVRRWEEVTDLPPQALGPFTGLYKMLTSRLKVMPWPAFAAVATLVAVGCYLVFGSAVTLVVSLLQRGF